MGYRRAERCAQRSWWAAESTLGFQLDPRTAVEVARAILRGEPVAVPVEVPRIAHSRHRVEMMVEGVSEPIVLAAELTGVETPEGLLLRLHPEDAAASCFLQGLACDNCVSTLDDDSPTWSLDRDRSCGCATQLRRDEGGNLRIGRYQLHERITVGATATVYLGALGGSGGFSRRVAIKVVHPHLAADPVFRDMFLYEARVAAQIHHPNMVSTIDVRADGGLMLLVMEHVAGRSLWEIKRSFDRVRGRVPVGVALRIIVDVLEGLHAVHELVDPKGAPLEVIHRDVSPHNMLVGYDGVARLSHFGMAPARERLTTTMLETAQTKGAYQAPEQALCDALDRRADVYAVGLVLWELLTGKRLFAGLTEAEVVAKVLRGVRRSPRGLVSDVPRHIDATCMHALAYAAVDRPHTAASFAEALHAAAYADGIALASAREVAALVDAVDGGLPERRCEADPEIWTAPALFDEPPCPPTVRSAAPRAALLTIPIDEPPFEAPEPARIEAPAVAPQPIESHPPPAAAWTVEAPPARVRRDDTQPPPTERMNTPVALVAPVLPRIRMRREPHLGMLMAACFVVALGGLALLDEGIGVLSPPKVASNGGLAPRLIVTDDEDGDEKTDKPPAGASAPITTAAAADPPRRAARSRPPRAGTRSAPPTTPSIPAGPSTSATPSAAPQAPTGSATPERGEAAPLRIKLQL